MERSCFSRRITVDSDNSTYPCSSAYIGEHGRLWWEFEFLHSSLVDRGLTKRLCKFEAECASTLRGKVSDGEYHLGLKDVPTSHIARIVTSNALLNVLAHVIDKTLTASVHLYALTCVSKLTGKAIENYHNSHITFAEGVSIEITSAGRAYGFRAAVTRLMSKNVAKAIGHEWDVFFST